MAQCVQVHKENGIALVTLENTPLNLISKQMVEELGQIAIDLKHDPTTRVVIFTGAGNKAFAAGADINEFPEMVGNPYLITQINKNHNVLSLIEQLTQPTIAVINGVALGGGCELILACDLRIAEEHAEFGFPEVKLGIMPGWGGTVRLPRLIGMAKAKELMLLGENISSQEAEQIGLVNMVVPTGQGIETAQMVAKRLASYSSQSLTRIKASLNYALNHSLAESIVYEASLFAEIYKTEDIKEGFKAFKEKRPPNFKHR